MLTAGEINILIRARDQASRVFGHVGNTASRMGQTIRRATIVGVAAFAALGAASLMMAGNFETAFAEVTTLFDAPQAQIDALRQGVLDLSAEMGVDAIEATQALYQAISAGVAPDNALEFLNENVRLAVGGVTQLSTAVDLTTTVLNAWGLETEELGRVNDTLFTTVRLGKTTIDELGGALFNVAPAAAAAGISVEEVGAALAVLTASGVRTSEATTQLRQLILALEAPTRRTAKIMEDLGIKFEAGEVGAIGLDQALLRVNEATGGNIEVMRTVLGSVEAVQAALVLGGVGADDFAAGLAAMDDKAGATDVAFEKMNETFGRQVAILTSQLKVAMIEIGLRVLPLVTDAIQVLIPWLRDALPRAATTLQQKWEEFRPVVEALSSSFMSGVDVLREHLLPTLQAIADWFANNKPALIAVIAAIGLAIVLAFGPVSIAIAAILGLILVIGLVRDNWEMLKDETMRILGIVTDFIDEHMGIWDELIVATISRIVTFVRDNWDAISGIIFGALELIKLNIMDQLTFIRDLFRLVFALFQGDWAQAWDLLKQIVSDRLEFMRQRIEIVMGLIRDVFTLGWAAVQSIVVAALEGLRDVFVFAGAAFVDFWRELPGRIVQALGDLGRLLYNAGRDLIQGLADGVMDAWDAVKDTILDIVNPLNWDVPWGSPLLEAMAHAGERIGRTFIEGMAAGMEANMGRLGRIFGQPFWQNMNPEAMQDLLDLLNPNIPFPGSVNPGFPPDLLTGGPISDVPRPPMVLPLGGGAPGMQAGFGGGITQNITVVVEDRSPAAIAHAVERAGLELGEQLVAEGV